MNLVVTTEHRFQRTPDGQVWAQAMFTHSFWKRYLKVFDHVRVVARIRDVRDFPAEYKPAGGPGVSFAAVPHYLGPWQYLQQARQIRRATREAIGPREAVILRVSSRIASEIAPAMRQSGRPYAVEVVGDPYDVFAPGSVRHPLRPLLRWWIPRQLKRECAGACAAAYVTDRALQARYPAAPHAYSAACSDVELPDDGFVSAPRAPRTDTGPRTLISVGTLEQLYKAPDVLIDAVGVCVRGGLDLRLVLVGDGQYRPALEARAQALGLAGRVTFRGQLAAGPTVRTELDRADLFVLPSWQEGLPRAMIEAMARALPCIGSTVGGFPELLPPEDLVTPGDVTALAASIRALVNDPQRAARESARNWEQAKRYHEDALHARRTQFYARVREETEAWAASA